MMNTHTKPVNNSPKEPTRFHIKKGIDVNTLSPEQRKELLDKTFEMHKTFNDLESPTIINGKRHIKVWRIGKTTDSVLIIDIDDYDKENLSKITSALSNIFYESLTIHGKEHRTPERFITIKTKNGYQLIGTKISKEKFVEKNLLVLNTKLSTEQDFIEYKQKLISFLKSVTKDKNISGDFNNAFEKSDLCHPIGKIDYVYNVLGIINEFYSIRLTKKGKTDPGWEILTT